MEFAFISRRFLKLAFITLRLVFLYDFDATQIHTIPRITPLVHANSIPNEVCRKNGLPSYFKVVTRDNRVLRTIQMKVAYTFLAALKLL